MRVRSVSILAGPPRSTADDENDDEEEHEHEHEHEDEDEQLDNDAKRFQALMFEERT